MARFQIPNMAYIRQDDDKYASALQALAQGINNIADQSNADASGAESGAPSQIGGINVVEKGGIHDIQIQDETPAARGLSYFAEYSDSPDFANSHKVDLGASQNHRANLGPGKYYWRGYSAYSSSSHSEPVMHGGATASAVGSGEYSGPAMQARQGGLGFGPINRDSSTPVVRK